MPYSYKVFARRIQITLKVFDCVRFARVSIAAEGEKYNLKKKHLALECGAYVQYVPEDLAKKKTERHLVAVRKRPRLREFFFFFPTVVSGRCIFAGLLFVPFGFDVFIYLEKIQNIVRNATSLTQPPTASVYHAVV